MQNRGAAHAGRPLNNRTVRNYSFCYEAIRLCISCECAEEAHIHLEVLQNGQYLDPAKIS